MKSSFEKYILSFIVLSTLANPVFAGVDYNAGMNAYNKGDYKFAKTLFLNALKKDYYDSNSRYMYCQILIKEKNYNEAKRQYNIILSNSPSSQAGVYAKTGLKQIEAYEAKQAAEKNKQQQAQQATKVTKPASADFAISKEPDYVKNAYRGGKKYLRPLGVTRVYIPSDSNFRSLMINAYSEWQSAIGSRVMFSFSGNKQDASDIVVFAQGSASSGVHQGGNCAYKFSGDTLAGNTITINAYDKDGKPLPKEYVYHVMLHEIGHSIGIMGHSTNPDDVMAQGATKVISHLSQRDKNTARLLYQSYGKQPTKEAVQEAKTQELTDIAKRIPNDPSSLVDLGDEAMSAGKYLDALNYYKKAESLRSTTDICFRIVKAYLALGDEDNVATYYKKILTKDSKNLVALNNLLAMYQKQMRYVDGKKVLDDFLAANPDMANNNDIKVYKNIFSDTNVRIMEQRKKIFLRQPAN